MKRFLRRFSGTLGLSRIALLSLATTVVVAEDDIKVAIKDGKIIATAGPAEREITLFDDSIPKYGALSFDGRLVYSQMVAPFGRAPEISVVLADIKDKAVKRQISLSNSEFRYVGNDGVKYNVDLWQAPPPKTFKIIKYPYLMVSNSEKITNPMAGYIGVLNMQSGQMETVMKGDSISVSNDRTDPMIVASESVRFRKVEEGEKVTSDPIVYAWKSGLFKPERLQSRHPYKTASWIVFPKFLSMSEEDLWGFRLLTPPMWAPSLNRLAFLAYETQTKRAFACLLDFTRPQSDRPLTRYDIDLPKREKAIYEELIDNDNEGYIRIEAEQAALFLTWRDDECVTLTFGNKPRYFLPLGESSFSLLDATQR